MHPVIQSIVVACAVAVAGVAAAQTPAPHSAVSIFVAVNGSDNNPGTKDLPFATLQRAQRAARNQAGRTPVTVFLRGGTYDLPETLVFTAADSGTQQAPVTYRAYDHEQVVISGGMPLKGLDWKPYKNGIMQAKVPAGFSTDQLFVNGKQQILARYPNYDPNVLPFGGCSADAISPARVARWAHPAGGFIHALHRAHWGSVTYRILGKDSDGKLILAGGWQNNRGSGMDKRSCFVENVFEELDAPGEWYLDGKAGILYYDPPAGMNLADATVEGVRLGCLIEFRGTRKAPVRFLTLKDLTFRQARRTFMQTKEPLLRSDWCIYRGGALLLDGTEDCAIKDCTIERVGGNAVFVNDYNRRVTVQGCLIDHVGASGVLFIGDPNACHNPADWHRPNRLDQISLTPGPKTDNYPADCLVDDCLIHDIGLVEKQTAGVTMDIARHITVRHCSIYNTPRSGINIGDGCFGGHVIEFCDVFNTVRETGDHGSFNSWGRDRYWHLGGVDWKSDAQWPLKKKLVTLDACDTTVIRNNRWRCDRGWDIDLDDGSSNYHIYNNLCLHGGLKNREGFFRTVENNVIVNDTFHPHVWYKDNQGIFRHNIIFRPYAPIGMKLKPWGKEIDYNLLYQAGVKKPEPAAVLQQASGQDEHSIIADAMFVDPAKGDFQVKPDSPALKLGFVNFPMDQFGVQKPALKAIARTPEIPKIQDYSQALKTRRPRRPQPRQYFAKAQVHNIKGLDEQSAYGLPNKFGVLILRVPKSSPAAKAGLRKDDVIIECNGKPVRTISDLLKLRDQAAGKKLILAVIRQQQQMTVKLSLGGQ